MCFYSRFNGLRLAYYHGYRARGICVWRMPRYQVLSLYLPMVRLRGEIHKAQA